MSEIKEEITKVLIKALKNNDDVKNAIKEIVKELYCENKRKQQENQNAYETSQADTIEKQQFLIDQKEEKIKELYNKIQELETEKEQLQEEVEQEKRNKERMIQNAQEQLIVKDKEMHKYMKIQAEEKDNYEKALNKAKTELEKIKEKYQKLDEIYQLYLNLSSAVHSRLQRVLNPGQVPCESAEVFFAYGVQEGNITALWDVIHLYAQEYQDSGELESLLSIFDYFFQIFKAVSFKQVECYRPQIGEEFDERRHTRTRDSRVSGRIEKVIIPGVSIGQNITKKPLVYVR